MVFLICFVWEKLRWNLDHFHWIVIFLTSSLGHTFCSSKTSFVISSIFSSFFSIWTTLWAIVHYMFNILIWFSIVTLVDRIQISCSKSILIIVQTRISFISIDIIWVKCYHVSVLLFKIIYLVLKFFTLDLLVTWTVKECLFLILLSKPDWLKFNSTSVVKQTSYCETGCWFHFCLFYFLSKFNLIKYQKIQI